MDHSHSAARVLNILRRVRPRLLDPSTQGAKVTKQKKKGTLIERSLLSAMVPVMHDASSDPPWYVAHTFPPDNLQAP